MSVLICCTAFSCEAGEFLEMSSQQCTSCAAGSYSLGSGVRFDQWDSIPAGFSSLATYMDSGGSGDDSMTCNKSVPSCRPIWNIYSVYISIFYSRLLQYFCRSGSSCLHCVVQLQFFMDSSGNSLGIQSWRLHCVAGVRGASHEAGIRLLWLSICRQQRLLRVLCVFYFTHLAVYSTNAL